MATQLNPKKIRPTPPLVIIIGETAAGKSSLAIWLAKKFSGEIICADSQTLRRELNIGTAKPTAEDQRLVKHHLLDIIDPDQPFSVAQFKRFANEAIEDIVSRNKIPILVGGTGLYIDSVLFDYDFRPTVYPDQRDTLNSLSVEELQTIIAKRSLPLPNNPKNPRHLIRIIETGGMPPKPTERRSSTLLLYVKHQKEELINRIEQRVDQMFEQGFVDEVERLRAKYGHSVTGFDAIGYSVVARSLEEDGRASKEDLKEKVFVATRQYAKRQRTWFKRYNFAHEIDSELAAEIEVRDFLNNKKS